MNAQDLTPLFERIFDSSAARATLPMLVLGVGVLLFLIADIVDRLRPLRTVVFIATIAVAFGAELGILLDAPGTVLDGTLVADATTALWGMIFLLAALFAWSFGHGYYKVDGPFKPEHDALMLSAPAGMMLMAGACDWIVFFIGLELLSIPLYALAAFQRGRVQSVEAGLKYFLLGSFSSGFFLFGTALLYFATGTLDVVELSHANFDSSLALTGVGLILTSLMFKVSVFPFHLWVPDVYQGSPTPVTALMAAGTKAAAFAFLVRITGMLPQGATWVIALIALITMAVGNLGALAQTDLKRLLAYSSVAHAGTLFLVVAGGMAGASSADTSTAVLYYAGAYLFTVTGAFGLVCLIESSSSSCSLDSIRGLARRRPAIGAALALFMLSLGGIPATGGFLGKWFVFSVLVHADLIGVAVIGALLSVVALGYYLRVIVLLYMLEPGEETAQVQPRPVIVGATTAVCCLFVLLMGLLPQIFLAPLAP